MSTRTSALKGCFMVSPRIARDRDESALVPAPLAITNRRTSVSSRRAGSVVPKPAAVARAADTQRSADVERRRSVKPVTLPEMERAKRRILANAAGLVAEAHLLLRQRHHARAYALAHLACEELSKLPMVQRAAIEFAVRGSFDWKKLQKRFTSHTTKLEGMFVHEYLLDPDIAGDADVRRLEAALASIGEQNRLKNASLYCSLENGRCVSPKVAISKRQARAMVHIAEQRLGWFRRTEATVSGKLAKLRPEELKRIFDWGYRPAEAAKEGGRRTTR